jgi:hypothetical protein
VLLYRRRSEIPLLGGKDSKLRERPGEEKMDKEKRIELLVELVSSLLIANPKRYISKERIVIEEVEGDVVPYVVSDAGVIMRGLEKESEHSGY